MVTRIYSVLALSLLISFSAMGEESEGFQFVPFGQAARRVTIPGAHETRPSGPPAASLFGGLPQQNRSWSFSPELPAGRKLPRIVLMGEVHYQPGSKRNLDINAKYAVGNGCVLALEGALCDRFTGESLSAFDKERLGLSKIPKPNIHGYDDPFIYSLSLLFLGNSGQLIGSGDKGSKAEPGKTIALYGVPKNDLMKSSLDKMLEEMGPAYDDGSSMSRIFRLVKEVVAEPTIEAMGARLDGLAKNHPWNSDNEAVREFFRIWASYLIREGEAKYRANGEYCFPALPGLVDKAFRNKDYEARFWDESIVDVRNHYMAKNLAYLYCKEAAPRGLDLRVITGLAHVKGLSETLRDSGPKGLEVQTLKVKMKVDPIKPNETTELYPNPQTLEEINRDLSKLAPSKK